MAGATNRDLKLTCQIGYLTMHAIHFTCNRTNLQDCLQKRHPCYAPLPRPLLVGEVEFVYFRRKFDVRVNFKSVFKVILARIVH